MHPTGLRKRQPALPFWNNANIARLQTLRYAGFPEFVNVLVNIGFLSDEEQSYLKEPIPWKEATQKIIGASSSSEKDLLWAISSKTTFKDNNEKNRLIAGLTWGENPCAL
jgi:saccharopine dehydrogenase (NADP+, L-glutamate forming)